MFLRRRSRRPLLYISWLSWARAMSLCCSLSEPNRRVVMVTRCLLTSSCAFSWSADSQVWNIGGVIRMSQWKMSRIM